MIDVASSSSVDVAGRHDRPTTSSWIVHRRRSDRQPGAGASKPMVTTRIGVVAGRIDERGEHLADREPEVVDVVDRETGVGAERRGDQTHDAGELGAQRDRDRRTRTEPSVLGATRAVGDIMRTLLVRTEWWDSTSWRRYRLVRWQTDVQRSASRGDAAWRVAGGRPMPLSSRTACPSCRRRRRSPCRRPSRRPPSRLAAAWSALPSRLRSSLSVRSPAASLTRPFASSMLELLMPSECTTGDVLKRPLQLAPVRVTVRRRVV